MDKIGRLTKEQIDNFVFTKANGTVLSGPFSGMKLLPEACWKSTTISPQILGCYEAELHEPLEQEIAKRPAKVVNMGCAEGYYAVGLARRLPSSRIIAMDIDRAAGELTRRNAELNGVDVEVVDFVFHALQNADLIVMDCEGGEVEYLNPEIVPTLAKSTIIVECHETKEQHTNQILFDRFKDSHVLVCLWSEILGRNPNQYEILRDLHSNDKWLAVSEGRPCMMNYLVMRPK